MVWPLITLPVTGVVSDSKGVSWVLCQHARSSIETDCQSHVYALIKTKPDSLIALANEQSPRSHIPVIESSKVEMQRNVTNHAREGARARVDCGVPV